MSEAEYTFSTQQYTRANADISRPNKDANDIGSAAVEAAVIRISNLDWFCSLATHINDGERKEWHSLLSKHANVLSR